MSVVALAGVALLFGLPRPPVGEHPPLLDMREEDVPPPEWIEVKNPAFPHTEIRAVPANRGRAYVAADLSPYFGEGKLAEARVAFEKGRFAEARGLLAGQGDSLPVRYLRGVAALRSADFAAAAAELSKLAGEYAAIRDRCLLHSGMAYEELKDFSKASEQFSQVPSTSRLYIDGRLGLARVLRKSRQLTAAAESLASVAALPAPPWGRDIGAEALLALADVHAAAKNVKGEREALLRLWSLHPLTGNAARAEARLGAQERFPDEVLVARAEALVDVHRNKQGMAVVQPLLGRLKLPDPLACRAHFTFGKGLRKERNHPRAVQVLAPVVASCKDPELLPKALYTLATSQSVVAMGDAVASYDRLARDFPKHPLADDALFFSGDTLVKLGKPAQAVERLAKVGENYPSGDFAADALFKQFWVERASGRVESALAVLGEIETHFAKADDSFEVERAQYWRARLLEKGGSQAQAVAQLVELGREHPGTYYGLVARTRLERIAPEVGAALVKELERPVVSVGPWPLYAGPLEADPHFLAAVELLRLGFGEAVPMEVLAIDRTRLPTDSMRLLVMVVARAGDQRAAHALARVWLRRDLSGRLTPQNRELWEIAYPNAFRELIEGSCKEASIEPDLLQALMREESALDPKALSWAGAIGLTQLMPSTALMVSIQLKLKKFNTQMLYEPDTNVRIGATFLGGLVRRFNGVKQYAVASYNAGEGAVARWRRDFPTEDLDEWSESIPIAETRGYVRRVLRSYNTYQLVWSSRAPTLNLPAVPAAGAR